VLSNTQTVDKSVIIVGAGLSGYSAARKLLENGFNDITILEASGRIGGRIYSVPLSNGMVDSGAQWVHGQLGNSIYQLVSPHFSFGSTPVDLHYPIFVLSNGTTPLQGNFQMLYSLGYTVLDN
jgi:phytoene dehydrogenase-like protein